LVLNIKRTVKRCSLSFQQFQRMSASGEASLTRVQQAK